MAKTRRAGSDQPLKGPNLIGKATLNVLEPGGGREIIVVEEKRLHLCHEHIGVAEEVARLRSGKYIQRLNVSERHVSSVIVRPP